MINKLVPSLFLILLFFTGTQAADYRLDGEPQKIAGSSAQKFIRPLWSPDGSKIAFTSPGYKGLWVASQSGVNLTQISDETGVGFGFDWSADGQAIVMRSTHYSGAFRKHAIKVFNFSDNTSSTLRETNGRIGGVPKWSSDNSAVYFLSDSKLQIIPTGRQALSKTASPYVYADRGNILVQRPGISESSSWSPIAGKDILNLNISPDGTKICFEILGGNLFVANLDGTDLLDLGKGYRPAWSPGSTHLIYMVTEDDGHEYISSELYISNVADGASFPLTTTPDRLEMNPSWSPDGRKIVYDEYTEGAIYLIQIIPE